MAAAHAELVELLRHRKAPEGLLDQEGGDAAGPRGRIGLGIDDQDIGVGSVGDPHLAAVEPIVVAAQLGAQRHRHHIGAGARLGHGQRADVLATDQPGQILAALGLAAIAHDLVHAQVGVRPVGQAHRGRPPGDLLHGHDVREIAHLGAAVLLGHGHAEHAEIPELAPEVHRELVLAVDLRGPRGDLGRGELLQGLAQHGDVLAEVEGQAGDVQHADSWGARGAGCARGRRGAAAHGRARLNWLSPRF